jgi:hypothetical protein
LFDFRERPFKILDHFDEALSVCVAISKRDHVPSIEFQEQTEPVINASVGHGLSSERAAGVAGAALKASHMAIFAFATASSIPRFSSMRPQIGQPQADTL